MAALDEGRHLVVGHKRCRLLAWSVAVVTCMVLRAASGASAYSPPAGQQPMDEAMRDGIVPECFQPEKKDLFWPMDQVAVPGRPGELQGLNLQGDEIKGRNTWLAWCAGNEHFWDWLATDGYGVLDMLKLIDSRGRSERFKKSGLMNQPGMVERKEAGPWGLYIDQLVEPLTAPGGKPVDVSGFTSRRPHVHGDQDAQPDDKDSSGRRLVSDGLDPFVYGYPSGVIGLRLFPNPKFFAKTTEGDDIRKKWDASAYYDEYRPYSRQRELVRPYRVGMSCAFCHVAPHPLNPPKDPENPRWENLSSVIGNQYWRPQPAFGNSLKPDNFLFHYLASQQPGTIDTSLVSTDHINNANTIIPVFELPERLKLSRLNPPELQSPATLAAFPSIEDQAEKGRVNPRHVPRVLIDGSDGAGAFAALVRVYLNIGTFSEEWNTCHNPIIGFKHQRPFTVEACEKRSVYFRSTEELRAKPLAAFFTQEHTTQAMHLKDAPGGKAIVDAEAAKAKAGRAVFVRNCMICHSSRQPQGFRIDFSPEWQCEEGRLKALTKTPFNNHLVLPMLAKDWDAFKDSVPYRKYLENAIALAEPPAPPPIAGAPQTDKADPFLDHNYLSTDIRVPVSLVGTNSGRAMATNAMRGQVWDNYSSETYKNLPSVGKVGYYNMAKADAERDEVGNNDAYDAPAGGPGYYRPASLATLWATAPYLHNNSLGVYNHDPSVAGRLAAFEDGIGKLLWRSRRSDPSKPNGWVENLSTHASIAEGDAGWIYRIPNVTAFKFPASQIHHLVAGIPAGAAALGVLEWSGMLALLFLGIALLTAFGTQFQAFLEKLRWWAIVLALALFWLVFGWHLALLLGIATVLTLTGWRVPARLAALPLAVLALVLAAVAFGAGAWRLLPWGFAGALLLTGALLFATVSFLSVITESNWWLILKKKWQAEWKGKEEVEEEAQDAAAKPKSWFSLLAIPLAALVWLVLSLATSLGGGLAHDFVEGRAGDLKLGSLPAGMPVNLFMNLDPAKPLPVLGRAVVGLVLGMDAVTKIQQQIRQQDLCGDQAAAMQKKALEEFNKLALPALLEASKCPDFVMDRGHSFGEHLTDQEKIDLTAFLKTL